MSASPQFAWGVIILAAGASSRMGAAKMLLPWGATTVLGHLVEIWSGRSATQIAVVVAANDAGVAAELDRIRFPAGNRILNPDPKRGMFSSIRCAACWTGWDPGLRHWIIVLGDQPHVQRSTLEALIKFAALHPDKICQPSWQSRARHPVILPKSSFMELRDAGAETLRDFLRARSAEVKLVEINDPGLDLDLDYPAEYKAARSL